MSWRNENSADRALNQYQIWPIRIRGAPKGGGAAGRVPQYKLKSTQTRNTARLRIQARLEVVDHLKGYTATNAEEEAYIAG